MLLTASSSAHADIVISEIMANTASGQNTTDEYVELCNTSSAAVDIAGWSITDGDDVDTIIAWNENPYKITAPTDTSLVLDSTAIPGGDCALLLDPSYGDGAQPYQIPAQTVILTVGNTAIGQGLSADDAITLYSATGTTSADVMDTYGTPVDDDAPANRDDDGLDDIPLDPREGHSAYRLHLSAPDVTASWMEGAPTPGFRGSVEAFEVSPDGSGDFETIAEALLYALSGSEIMVHPGTYSDELSIREAVTITAADTTTPPTISGAIDIDDVGGSIMLLHLNLTGGVTIDRADVHIQDCTLENTGAYYHYATGSFVRNSVSGAPTGITVDYYTNPEISENTFAGSSQNAIACTMGSAPWIHGNQLAASEGNGINCTSAPTIENNEVDGFENGIRITGDALVLHNQVQNASNAGILVGDGSQATVHGNIVTDNTWGIQTDHSAPTVSSNLVLGSSQDGIGINNSLRDDNFIDFLAHAVVLHNTVAMSGRDGIHVEGLSISEQPVAPTLSANLTIENTNAGIHITGTPTTQDNVSWNNGVSGFDGFTPDASDLEIDPLVVDNGANGDWSLSTSSPLIDAGLESGFETEFDAAGSLRITDGDGDGTATADIGGLELCPDLDGDGWAQDCGTADVYDCDDDNAEVSPDAEENWYDGVDQDCDGNDDDQDSDGYSTLSDCDDTDPEVVTGCPEDTGIDTGEDTKVDSGECGCSASSTPQNGLAWLVLVGGLALRRRRDS